VDRYSCLVVAFVNQKAGVLWGAITKIRNMYAEIDLTMLLQYPEALKDAANLKTVMQHVLADNLSINETCRFMKRMWN
jgi:hypothetical protein